MQTFLPYSDLKDSLAALDYRRLGKQRVETKQLLTALNGETKGWVNHPASKMWRGYETALAMYGALSCQIWLQRGYKDSLLSYFEERMNAPLVLPPWLGDERVHASHRSNLLRKDAQFYGQYAWAEPADLPYLWPVLTDYGYKLETR